MTKLNNSTAFRMISLLENSFRFAKYETHKLKNDKILTPREKYDKINSIEKNCVEDTLKHPKVDKDFIFGLHALLITYKSGDPQRRIAFKTFLAENAVGDIEYLFNFMNSELYGEYEQAISHPRFIIFMHLKNE